MTRALPFYNSVKIRSHIKMHFLDLSPQGAYRGFYGVQTRNKGQRFTSLYVEATLSKGG